MVSLWFLWMDSLYSFMAYRKGGTWECMQDGWMDVWEMLWRVGSMDGQMAEFMNWGMDE